ncbi:MAG: T9SS type A sorting domain-containing protein [Bacteroidales bacterium]|nr:T9SS type A sorting domain-containing protein [Bacteroidales bacterium]
MRIRLILVVILSIVLVDSMMSQEWEFKTDSGLDHPYYRNFTDAIELQDGNIVVNTPLNFNIPGHASVPHPGLMKISTDGTELARNNYFRPSYCSISYNQILENEEGELFALMTYSPDHERSSENYFMNFDNPPSEAVLGLYKLDEELNIVESYEHYIPIDTTENFGFDPSWDYMPNENCGRLYLFTSFIDNVGDIVGAFFKCPTFHSPNQAEHDSLFFFKMNFEGEILQMKGFEYPKAGINTFTYRRNCMSETDLHYILYQVDGVNGYDTGGEAMYMDKEFNLVNIKPMRHHSTEHPDYGGAVDYISVVRSSSDMLYLAARYHEGSNGGKYDCVLYEMDDNLNDSAEILPIIKHIRRGEQKQYDYHAFNNAIVLKECGSLIFVYNMDVDGLYHNTDSWVVIEHLNSNLETISSVYYTSDNDEIHTVVNSILSTKEEDLLLVGTSHGLEGDKSWCFVTKFPASAFLNIEEAHAHNLKLAVAYPNPGGDVMNIRTGLRNATLSVYDMQGRKIHEQEITDEITSVDASRWENGTYVWKLGIRNEELGMKCVESGKWVK